MEHAPGRIGCCLVQPRLSGIRGLRRPQDVVGCSVTDEDQSFVVEFLVEIVCARETELPVLIGVVEAAAETGVFIRVLCVNETTEMLSDADIRVPHHGGVPRVPKGVKEQYFPCRCGQLPVTGPFIVSGQIFHIFKDNVRARERIDLCDCSPEETLCRSQLSPLCSDAGERKVYRLWLRHRAGAEKVLEDSRCAVQHLVTSIGLGKVQARERTPLLLEPRYCSAPIVSDERAVQAIETDASIRVIRTQPNLRMPRGYGVRVLIAIRQKAGVFIEDIFVRGIMAHDPFKLVA